MICQQFDIWLADLNPANSRVKAATGKIRPVLIIQTDLLNNLPHVSTLVCPITSGTVKGASILRIPLKRCIANLPRGSAVMIDQIRAIDHKRLLEKLGTLPMPFVEQVKKHILLVFDIY
ncbi:MAG: type II toxin-antitoxin system PemK/MazF family toxin [Prevotellaceae bacterium]|jgi:mRNA interferase MazF|nr:type II toxin-antitoxin system PemK/MazF family toxin [Prevotellaceae bacterium]